MRKPIARVIQPQQQGLTGPQVGKYSVDVLSFEEIALPVINKALNIERDKNTIVIIDEIGKMEMFSEISPSSFFVKTTLRELSTFP